MLLGLHIPFGMLDDPLTIVVTCLAAIIGIGGALYRLNRTLADRLIPILGVTAAGLFAAQMVNFPLVVVPASGHLIGGVLAAVVLGPWGGAVAMTAVLVVQCFLFGDGGVIELGANVLNMAVIGSIGGYYLYATFARLIGGRRGVIVGAAVAAWLVIPMAGLAVAVELAQSGKGDFLWLAIMMLFIHTIFGVAEAAITGLVVVWLLRARPDLIYGATATKDERPLGTAVAAAFAVALATAVFLAPFASALPDGLESVIAKLGLTDGAVTPSIAPFPDYSIPGVVHGVVLLTPALGFLGTVVTLVFAFAVARSAKLVAPTVDHSVGPEGPS